MRLEPQSKSVYESSEVPADYRCTGCQARGCKLWRQYQAFLAHQELFCVACAVENQRDSATAPKDPAAFDDEGRADGKYGKGDQIGWLVPAVPTEENDTFYGYSSVPAEGCRWWRELPTHPDPGHRTVARVTLA